MADACELRRHSFQGTVNNEPEKVKTVKMGQKVTVAAKISDWMYVENRKLVGGYTMRVLRSAYFQPRHRIR